MQRYNNFNEMFNAQSGLKSDMSVFNDATGLQKVANQNGFELVLEKEKDLGFGGASASYCLKSIEPLAELRSAKNLIKKAIKYYPSWVALNSDLDYLPLDMSIFSSRDGYARFSDVVDVTYFGGDQDMDVYFSGIASDSIQVGDANGERGARGWSFSMWDGVKSPEEGGSVHDWADVVQPEHYVNVVSKWDADLKDFNRRAQDTIELARRYRAFLEDNDKNPMSGEARAYSSFPSEYYGVADTSYGNDYTDTINFG